jgi:hypothetical protein
MQILIRILIQLPDLPNTTHKLQNYSTKTWGIKHIFLWILGVLQSLQLWPFTSPKSVITSFWDIFGSYNPSYNQNRPFRPFRGISPRHFSSVIFQRRAATAARSSCPWCCKAKVLRCRDGSSPKIKLLGVNLHIHTRWCPPQVINGL